MLRVKDLIPYIHGYEDVVIHCIEYGRDGKIISSEDEDSDIPIFEGEVEDVPYRLLDDFVVPYNRRTEGAGMWIKAENIPDKVYLKRRLYIYITTDIKLATNYMKGK